MRSQWSKNYYAHVLFDKIIAETKAKYIIFSYNNDGFMSKDFIETTMKRYGIEDSYVCEVIDYKNTITSNAKEQTDTLNICSL